jgi:hypothetical protein
MGAIIALFFLGLFGSRQPVCPPLRNTQIPIYGQPKGVTVEWHNGMLTETPATSSIKNLKMKEGYYYNMSVATITVDMGTGQILGEVVGYKTDQSAVDYNKKVEQCKINGNKKDNRPENL